MPFRKKKDFQSLKTPLIDITMEYKKWVYHCSSPFFAIFTVSLVSVLGFSLSSSSRVLAYTNPSDVEALQVFYSSISSPSQLSGWKSSGGDPCGESWKGVTCEGSAVVALQVAGLGLSGTLGYLLSDLLSLRTMDLSNNGIHEMIPYQLPPNLTSLNLAGNNFSGNLPYSISNMASLNYLNVSHNLLSQSIGDLFANHQHLASLDLSFNNLSGDLPNSFSSLSTLSSLYLQNNQLTGSVEVLANLTLTELNIANNHFTGWIPWKLNSTSHFIYDGNSFDNGPASSPRTPLPHNSTLPKYNHTGPFINRTRELSNNRSHKELRAGNIVGVALGSGFVILCVMVVLIFSLQKISKDKYEENSRRAFLGIPSAISEEKGTKGWATAKDQNKTPPSEKSMTDRTHEKNVSRKSMKTPITATSFTVASLQTATNSFSQDSLVGEGSLGRVYKAELPDEKILAVKKIDSSALTLQEEDNFLEAVSNMSRLRHPNIITLIGYCTEHGQRLLVYEYFGNGTLHDMLHYAEDSSKALTWNARVKIALGTARALEYLHEVCLPPVVHRNFKSANILLDEELNPKLSDCGLAALTPNAERQVSTQMIGSFGYSAPEFAMSGFYTAKSDVYSFGVVMLEMLTGRKPLDRSRIRSEQSLVRWATPHLHDIDAQAKMVDPALNGMYPAKSLSRFADIIAQCIQPEPEFRPPISEVVQALVKLMQRASTVKRHPSEDSGLPSRVPDHDTGDDSLPLEIEHSEWEVPR